VAEALAGRPLVLRTLDVGADKPLPYLPQPVEANPFLGARGIRLALARPELLEGQLHAATRVAAEFPVKVMFPMVATLEEYRAAAAVAGSVRDGLAEAGVPVPERVELGIMVEVPATALVAEAFAPEVAFFSVGTNDLAQYTMAAERGNERVASLGDALHPAVLRLLRSVTSAAAEHGAWVGVCGELAGDVAAVPVLVGLGVRELSVSPPLVAAVKQAVRELDLPQAEELAQRALRLHSAAAVRALVASGGEVVGADGRRRPSAAPS
jgi:multiphosphoryl transfer protein